MAASAPQNSHHQPTSDAPSSSPPSISSSPSTALQDCPQPTQSTDQAESDESKLKQLLSVLKKAIGVKDMGAMKLSLPANLMAPIGNLEYWCYLDRPDLFAAIDHSDDSFERMLAVIRWTFSKDCKFVHGPVCKPYNSVLGEQFRCIFDVSPTQVEPDSGELIVLGGSSRPTSLSSTPQIPLPHRPASLLTTSSSNPGDDNVLADPNRSVSTIATTVSKPFGSARVVFLNEQVSHHPPISCFWYESRMKNPHTGDFATSPPNVIAHGVDQISAKFTGTSIKVFPGPFNKGIFVRLPNRDETYEITHPTATITGLLRASPYVVITDYSYITCRGPGSTQYRAMINYVEESWIGKPRFAIEGVVYEVKDDSELEWSKLKHIPTDRIRCRLSGSWRGLITYTLAGQQDSHVLVDLSKLAPSSKTVKPESNQIDNETRKLWKPLTELILAKNYAEATKAKHTIEEAQRVLAAQRKSSNESFKPSLFTTDNGSKYLELSQPELTKTGYEVLAAEFEGVGY